MTNFFARARNWFPLVGVAIYLAFRFFHHANVQSAGFVEGGPLSYDTYYLFAFARELSREAHWFFFQNPFGSFDVTPKLFNLSASILNWLHPLFDGHLPAFDFSVSLFFIFLGLRSLALLLEELPSPLLILVLTGGGLASLATLASGFDLQILTRELGYWGMTPVTNWIATPEIVYNAIFLCGLTQVIQRKNRNALMIAGLLWLLHPFTACVYSFALAAAFHQNFYWQKNKSLKPVLILAAMSAAMLALWAIIAPAYSKDAAYFKYVYNNAESSSVRPWMYFGSIAIPLLLFASLLAQRNLRNQIIGVVKNDSRVFIFSATALLCICISNAPLVLGIHVLQPAHWSRFYPAIFLTAAGVLLIFKTGAWSQRSWRVSILIFVLLGSADSATALYGISTTLVHDAKADGGAPPAIISKDLNDVIEVLRNQPPGRFAYFSSCAQKIGAGYLEYAIMSETDFKAPYGHLFFSPQLARLAPLFHLCAPPGAQFSKLLSQFDIVIFDTSLGELLAPGSSQILFSGPQLSVLKKN